jgi:nucleotide-binding universal stress UspA family protein
MKILAAYDGSGESERALDWAANLAKGLEGSSVTILSVAPTLDAAPHIADAVDPSSNVERHRIQAEKAAARLAGSDVKAQTLVRAGNPAEEILNVADEQGFDVVILGHRGISATRRFLMGSVSERVVRHASRPVLVIP